MNTILQIDKSELRDILNEIVTDAVANFRESVAMLQDEPGTPPLIYGIKGLAEFLNVSVPTAQKLKNDKIFPSYQRGRTIVFKSSEVLRGMQTTKKH